MPYPLSKRGSGHPVWLLPFVLFFVLLLSVLPLGRLGLAGLRAFARGGSAEILAAPATWSAVVNSLVTSAGGMVIAVVLGAVFALALTLTDIRGRLPLAFAFMLPLMIPPQVTALAWLQMTGPSSPLLNTLGLAPPIGSPQPLYSRSGIALLLGIQGAPLVFLAVRAGLLALPREAVEAARLAGARPARVLIDIVLPLAAPSLIAAAAIAFVAAVGNFGIPALLGIPASILVLPTLIYSRLAAFGTDVFGDIAALSLLIALIVLAGIVLQQACLRGRDVRIIGTAGGRFVLPLGRFRAPLEAALWALLALILVGPLIALVASSLVPTYGVRLTLSTISFSAYREVLLNQAATATAFRNSFLLAGLAAAGLLVVTVPVSVWLNGRRGAAASVVTALFELPYALPGIVVAAATIILFARPIPLLGVSIYGTLSIILFAYACHFVAVSLKPVQSALAQADPALEEAARLSGAGFLRRLVDIVLPTIAPAAGASFVLVFLIAVNELTVSALLWSAGTQTLGVLVYNLDDSGASDLSSALSVLIVLMVFALMLILEAVADRLPEGVVPWRA